LSPTSNVKGFIRNLSSDEAFLILQKLFFENPDLEKLIYQTALKVVSNVDAEEIANDLHDDLQSLDTDELFNRSGSSRHGYIEPHDEAWVMFEETVEPYISEMKKYHQREISHAVKEYCLGIIEGLMMFEKEGSEFSEWVENAPKESISYVIDEYKQLQPSVKDVVEIMKKMEELEK